MGAVGAAWGMSTGRLMAWTAPDMREARALWPGFSLVGRGFWTWISSSSMLSSRRRRSSSSAAAPVKGGGEGPVARARRAAFVGEPMDMM